MPVTFTCQHCGKSVTVPPSCPRRFCSRACHIAHSRVQKICIICGEPFENTVSRAKEQATCRSEACKKAVKFGAHNPFYGKQHTKATQEKISRAKVLPRIEVTCSCGCGEMVSVEERRARRNKTNVFFIDSDHMHTWLQGENHWNYRGGNIYYGDGWNKVAQAVRERDKVCQQCGKTPEENGRALDVHHKNPARVSHDNSMENLIALCMSCHHKINPLEQSAHPHKRGKYRACLECGRVFIPAPFQKFCSEECHRKRERKWEKKYCDTHPEYVQQRRRYAKRYYQAKKARANAPHQ